MAIRCDSCNRFRSPEPQDIDDQALEVSGDTITGTVIISGNCPECGDQIATAEVEANIPLPEKLVWEQV